MVRHIVLFAFKKPLGSPEVENLDKLFKELPSKIDEIQAFECGTDVSIEGIAKGYEKAYVLTFNDERGRDTYYHHPIHQEFVEVAKPHLEDVLVFDYVPENG